MTRPRTIAFFDIPYHSRLVTTLPIVRALVARGHRVVGFTLEPYRELLAGAGAEVMLQPPFGPMPEDPTLALRTIEYSLGAVPALVDTLQELKPALVLSTAKCLWASIAAERCGLPTAVVHTNALLPRGASVSDEVYAARWPGKTAEQIATCEARDHAAWAKCAAQYAVQRVLTADVLPGLPNCMNLRGDLNLVYTSDELQPRRAEFDKSYHFVGPCYDQRPVDADPDFELALDALPRPVVYAGLGSMRIYNERQNLFQSICSAFAGGDYGLVAAVGSAERVAALGPVSAHRLLRPYVPQLAVLSRAAVFITHAGTNSVYESLLAGVPMLMLPQGGDQPLFAEHIESVGLGRWLRDASIPPTELRTLVEEVLADRALATRVRACGDGLRRAGGVERAAALISAFAASAA